jgi:hypothetical protein
VKIIVKYIYTMAGDFDKFEEFGENEGSAAVLGGIGGLAVGAYSVIHINSAAGTASDKIDKLRTQIEADRSNGLPKSHVNQEKREFRAMKNVQPQAVPENLVRFTLGIDAVSGALIAALLTSTVRRTIWRHKQKKADKVVAELSAVLYESDYVADWFASSDNN